jgi:hypothetical protein
VDRICKGERGRGERERKRERERRKEGSIQDLGNSLRSKPISGKACKIAVV